jgi:hypothetical protein
LANKGSITIKGSALADEFSGPAELTSPETASRLTSFKNPDSTDTSNVPEKSADCVQSASFVQATTCVDLASGKVMEVPTVILGKSVAR